MPHDSIHFFKITLQYIPFISSLMHSIHWSRISELVLVRFIVFDGNRPGPHSYCRAAPPGFSRPRACAPVIPWPDPF